jgi:hypothetical protein
MKFLLRKCKHEKIEAYEWTKNLRNSFLNAQKMPIQ